MCPNLFKKSVMKVVIFKSGYKLEKVLCDDEGNVSEKFESCHDQDVITTTNYDVCDLISCRYYCFRVRAINRAGEGDSCQTSKKILIISNEGNKCI